MDVWVGNLGDQLTEENRQIIRSNLQTLDDNLGEDYKVQFYIFARVNVENEEQARDVITRLNGMKYTVENDDAPPLGECENGVVC
jgi:hypothetical protein